jgi:hypothetical protein
MILWGRTWPADIVLGVTVAEALAFILLRRRRQLRALLPGAALLVALRMALSGAPDLAIAACLAIAGLLHGLDLLGSGFRRPGRRRRKRRGKGAGPASPGGPPPASAMGRR